MKTQIYRVSVATNLATILGHTLTAMVLSVDGSDVFERALDQLIADGRVRDYDRRDYVLHAVSHQGETYVNE